MWGVRGLQVYGIYNRRLVYREVVETQSDYKKSQLCLTRLGVTRLKITGFL